MDTTEEVVGRIESARFTQIDYDEIYVIEVTVALDRKADIPGWLRPNNSLVLRPREAKA